MRVLAPVLALALASCSMFSPQQPETTSPLAPGASTQRVDAVASTGASPTELAAMRTPAVDSSKRFEYADVYVNMTDPTSQRQLASYFLKPEVWTIDKFEQLSDTFRHFRFRRLAGQDGKSLPDVDPLAPKK